MSWRFFNVWGRFCFFCRWFFFVGNLWILWVCKVPPAKAELVPFAPGVGPSDIVLLLVTPRKEIPLVIDEFYCKFLVPYSNMIAASPRGKIVGPIGRSFDVLREVVFFSISEDSKLCRVFGKGEGD